MRPCLISSWPLTPPNASTARRASSPASNATASLTGCPATGCATSPIRRHRSGGASSPGRVCTVTAPSAWTPAPRTPPTRPRTGACASTRRAASAAHRSLPLRCALQASRHGHGGQVRLLRGHTGPDARLRAGLPHRMPDFRGRGQRGRSRGVGSRGTGAGPRRAQGFRYQTHADLSGRGRAAPSRPRWRAWALWPGWSSSSRACPSSA